MDDLSPIVYKNGVIVNKLASDIVYQINDRNTADVVERVEYERLCKEYKHYRRLVEQDDDLRSKIDKAIEEIEQLINHSKLPTVNINNRYSDGVKDCLEIIDKYIQKAKEQERGKIMKFYIKYFDTAEEMVDFMNHWNLKKENIINITYIPNKWVLIYA